MGALQKGVGTLLEIDSLFAHADRQPVVVIEANPRGERAVRAHPDEHPTPVRVAQVEVQLIHPALLVLQVRAVVVPISDGPQDARGFPRLHDGHHLVRLGMLKIRVQEPVAPAVIARASGRFENGNAPLQRTILQPILELVGDVRQGLPGYSLSFAVNVEEPEDALGLRERLDQAVEPETVETPVSKPDAIRMMLDEGVHGHSPVVRHPELIAVNAS